MKQHTADEMRYANFPFEWVGMEPTKGSIKLGHGWYTVPLMEAMKKVMGTKLVSIRRVKIGKKWRSYAVGQVNPTFSITASGRSDITAVYKLYIAMDGRTR